MGVKYGPEVRQRMIEQMKGRVITELEYVEVGEHAPNSYWVIHLDDDTETCVRFMAEIHDLLPPGM